MVKSAHNVFKLDVKDKKLLALLSNNYRFPVSFLAKKAGISKDSVNYRLKRLWKEGVIVGSDVVFNPFLAGMQLFFVLIRLHNISPAKEKNILSFLAKNNRVMFLLKTRGSWDLMFFIGSRDAMEFDEFMTGFRNRYSDALDEFIFLVVSREYKFRQVPEALYDGAGLEPFSYKRNDSSFQKDFEAGPPIEISLGETMDLADNETGLLWALNSDIGASLTGLSMKLGVSKGKLKKDISSLIARGFLQAFWPVVSAKKLGFQEHFIFVKFRKLGREKELESFFRGSKYVAQCARLIGQWDLCIWIKASSINEFYSFVESMRHEFSEIIGSIDSMLVEDMVKWHTLCVAKPKKMVISKRSAQLRQ